MGLRFCKLAVPTDGQLVQYFRFSLSKLGELHETGQTCRLTLTWQGRQASRLSRQNVPHPRVETRLLIAVETPTFSTATINNLWTATRKYNPHPVIVLLCCRVETGEQGCSIDHISFNWSRLYPDTARTWSHLAPCFYYVQNYRVGVGAAVRVSRITCGLQFNCSPWIVNSCSRLFRFLLLESTHAQHTTADSTQTRHQSLESTRYEVMHYKNRKTQFFKYMVRRFFERGDFITCPLFFTVKTACQGVRRIAVCQGVQLVSIDIYQTGRRFTSLTGGIQVKNCTYTSPISYFYPILGTSW